MQEEIVCGNCNTIHPIGPHIVRPFVCFACKAVLLEEEKPPKEETEKPVEKFFSKRKKSRG